MQPNRQRALELLIGGATATEVASALEVRRETVWRWQQEPQFAGALVAAQRARLAATRSTLDFAAVRAIDTIIAIMDDVEQPAAVRLRAADSLLKRATWATSDVTRLPEPERGGGADWIDNVPEETARELEALLRRAQKEAGFGDRVEKIGAGFAG